MILTISCFVRLLSPVALLFCIHFVVCIFEPRHEISNNVIHLTQHDLEFLSLKGGFTGSYESTLVKILHCLKLPVAAKEL